MAVDLIKTAFNYETKYRVTMLTREEWTRGTGTPPAIKVLIWFTDGSRMEGTGAGVYGKSMERRLRVSLGMYATVFKAEIYAILEHANEIQFYGRSKKHLSI
jgi:hypothetical protein